MTPERPALSISVDVEDWPQSTLDPSLPLGDACADTTRRLLDLLAESPGSRATFFVLGLFAERHPKVVDEIRQAGHEIGSHGYGHVDLFRLTPVTFAEDVNHSVEVIGAACGVRPRGYRAPDFSVVGESLWALDALAEAGFDYDSSIFPIAKARYGIPQWPRGAARVLLKSGGTIVEMPIATLAWRGRRLPVGGGGYARLIPGPLLVRALRRACAQMSSPPVFYCHPYEMDPGEFRRLPFSVPLKVRLHQGLGRRGIPSKLRRIFRDFEAVSLGEALARTSGMPTIDYGPFVLEPGAVDRPQPV